MSGDVTFCSYSARKASYQRLIRVVYILESHAALQQRSQGIVPAPYKSRLYPSRALLNCADETTLTLFNTTSDQSSSYPLFLSLALMPKDLRRKPSNLTNLAFLPKFLKRRHRGAGIDKLSRLKRMLVWTCLRTVLRELIEDDAGSPIPAYKYDLSLLLPPPSFLSDLSADTWGATHCSARQSPGVFSCRRCCILVVRHLLRVYSLVHVVCEFVYCP